MGQASRRKRERRQEERKPLYHGLVMPDEPEFLNQFPPQTWSFFRAVGTMCRLLEQLDASTNPAEQARLQMELQAAVLVLEAEGRDSPEALAILNAGVADRLGTPHVVLPPAVGFDA